ncbi:Protein SDS23 [Nakaseomyces glabratus]|uniref:Protein SDS23 n=1 Tax=Candida glabrata TaxID=5478 RepID=A0A0W0C6R1_CANGB|nr:CBS domain profile [Nakaseomyces glabratus]KAH7596219.1 CBS domain profile [Nakaseomyces glabratus]KAH7611786.1 CBS domain profile [Nakaseomyces glabratus]KAI8394651.1 CBS domain profile [Nakaseomyces glabratus]KAJ9572661.1 cell separation during budding [Nakaseomyces glabratus]
MTNPKNVVPNSGTSSRHASIVEMLSSPPLLPHQHAQHAHVHRSQGRSESIESIPLQRSASGTSSITSMGSNNDSSSANAQSANPSAGSATNVGASGTPHSGSGLEAGNTDLSAVPMLQTPSQCLNSAHIHTWKHIQLSQLIEQNKLIFVPGSLSVEETFNTLIKYHLTSIPVEAVPGDMNCLTFDYNDLNSYLLLVLNKITINNKQVTQDCQNGKPVAVGDIVKLTPKNPFYKLPETENLSTVMGILGSGVHRVAITNPEMTQIRGILSQRRLIKYIWDNARSFGTLEPLLNSSLQDLKIGVLNTNSKPTSRQSRVISIQGEEPLIMALYKMHKERISSIAVIDPQGNLIGNISVTDVKHVTRTSQYPLLHKTCRHFISVILNSRGLETGKDSFPIFHVYPTSSLARTLAKLVATKSHRLWIVQPQEVPTATSSSSTSSSVNTGTISPNPTPTTTSASPAPGATPNALNNHSPLLSTVDDGHTVINPATQATNTTVIQPNLFEKEYRTGKLIGVVSLTDIINLLARKQTANTEVDPQTARRQRGPATQ